ncbi:nuclear transport factor 2 family protein [Actinacidiphila cocklensis]|uniref:nuclear transport factor 2 family protein n=1 Tax=Actinacidiphila cocklensis TaxID=887465 RepID=UPI0027E311D7|nr:nuclear transport factor 2 family protein [Actinacidiphila cocklensis]
MRPRPSSDLHPSPPGAAAHPRSRPRRTGRTHVTPPLRRHTRTHHRRHPADRQVCRAGRHRDFAGVGELFADDAVFTGGGAPVHGGDGVAAMLRDSVIRYEDGTPRTHHVTTDIVVDVDEEAGTAASRARVTVFQALPDFPLQPVAAGRYSDRFAHRDGRRLFVERTVRIHLAGDLSRHLRR